MHPSTCTHQGIAVATNLGYKRHGDVKYVVWGGTKGVVTCCSEIIRTMKMFVDREIVILVMRVSIGDRGLKVLGFC
jgi:predicted site-specific integrase-resolvase